MESLPCSLWSKRCIGVDLVFRETPPELTQPFAPKLRLTVWTRFYPGGHITLQWTPSLNWRPSRVCASVVRYQLSTLSRGPARLSLWAKTGPCTHRAPVCQRARVVRLRLMLASACLAACGGLTHSPSFWQGGAVGQSPNWIGEKECALLARYQLKTSLAVHNSASTSSGITLNDWGIPCRVIWRARFLRTLPSRLPYEVA